MSFKKYLATTLAAITLLAPTVVSAQSPEDHAIAQLKALKVIEGDENGNLHLDKPIKRSELSKIIVNAITLTEKNIPLYDTAPRYKDMPKGHWANKYINGLSMANDARNVPVLEGYEDKSFKPNKTTSIVEAEKILTVLADKSLTKERASTLSWPAGWVALAKTHGIDLKGHSPHDAAIRKDVFAALYNVCIKGKVVQKPEQPKENKRPEEKPKTNQLSAYVDAFNRGESFNKDAFQKELVSMINQERARRGIQPLSIDDSLKQGAEVRARELAEYGHMRINGQKHTRPDGSRFSTAFNYLPVDPNYHVGENLIMYSFPKNQIQVAQVLTKNPHYLAKNAFDAWLNSPGHSANMLNKGYSKIYIDFHASDSSQNNPSEGVLIGAMALCR